MITEVGSGLTLVLLVALAWWALRSRSSAELARQSAVADLRIAEAALRDSEARHRAVLDAALDAIVAMDEHGRLVEFNRGAEATFGRVRADVLGRMLAEVIVPPRLRDAHLRGVDRVRTTGETRILGQRVELDALRSDGTEFPAEVSIVPVSFAGSSMFFGFIRDVSDRREAERARTQAELLLAHADDLTEITVGLEAAYRELESFTHAVSHDLRAPLRAVGGFSAVLLEDYGDHLDDRGQNYLRRIGAAATRMSAMIDALLALSRIARSDLQHDDVDLDVIAAAAVEELQRAHPERQIEIRIQPELRTRGDARLLRIVFDNLLGNAWKFTAQQPAPVVEVGVVQQGDESVFFVRDNGSGFDMRYATRLFIPFQRLVSASDVPGTGIGLATVERIVRRHGGRIWTESEPGRGATFSFTLRHARS